MLYRISENKWYHDAQVSDIAYSYFAVDAIVTLIILVTTMKNISFERIIFLP